MRKLAEDQSIVIKSDDKGFCVVAWDRTDYLLEAEKHLSDSNTYKEVKFGDNELVKLVEEDNKMLKRLLSKKRISPGECTYFSYNFKTSTNLGKLYFQPKIHKRLYDVPGRPVISNCDTLTEKVSEYLDYHLKPIMRSAKSYIRDTSDFLKRLKELGSVTQNALLVGAHVVGLYPSIPHQDGLEALPIKLDQREEKIIPPKDLLEMARFVLKSNYFEFDSKIKQQVSGTTIGATFAPPYACIFMDRVEAEFLEKEHMKLWVWLRYIDGIFFV